MATYVQQMIHYPAPGKGPELRAVLEDTLRRLTQTSIQQSTKGIA